MIKKYWDTLFETEFYSQNWTNSKCNLNFTVYAWVLNRINILWLCYITKIKSIKWINIHPWLYDGKLSTLRSDLRVFSIKIGNFNPLPPGGGIRTLSFVQLFTWLVTNLLTDSLQFIRSSPFYTICIVSYCPSTKFPSVAVYFVSHPVTLYVQYFRFNAYHTEVLVVNQSLRHLTIF